MLFPSLLVTLFFVTLNFNHHVLYAPSDFRDEENYFKGLQTASTVEKAKKLSEEISQIESEVVKQTNQETLSDNKRANPVSASAERAAAPAKLSTKNIRSRYLISERLVLDKLWSQYGDKFIADVVLNSSSGKRLLFDGVIDIGGKSEFIEVKYVKDYRNVNSRAREVASRFASVYEDLPDVFKNGFSVRIIFVTEEKIPASMNDDFVERANEAISNAIFPMKVEIYNFGDLSKEQFL